MMDKAKAYDEALEKARQDRDAYQKELDKTDKNSQLANILRAGISALEMVFPVLKESDDERIRKDIIDHFESIKSQALYDNQEESDNIISSCNEKIAWLKDISLSLKKHNEAVEKLCSNEWTEEDEKMINTLVSYVGNPSCWNLKCPREKLVAFIESLPKKFSSQSKQEWSEEDKENINSICLYLDDYCRSHEKDSYGVEECKYLKSWLKSLRPSWKPSEHQMNILKAVKDYVGVGSGYWGEALGSLIEDLNKL